MSNTIKQVKIEKDGDWYNLRTEEHGVLCKADDRQKLRDLAAKQGWNVVRTWKS